MRTIKYNLDPEKGQIDRTYWIVSKVVDTVLCLILSGFFIGLLYLAFALTGGAN